MNFIATHISKFSYKIFQNIYYCFGDKKYLLNVFWTNNKKKIFKLHLLELLYSKYYIKLQTYKFSSSKTRSSPREKSNFKMSLILSAKSYRDPKKALMDDLLYVKICSKFRSFFSTDKKYHFEEAHAGCSRKKIVSNRIKQTYFLRIFLFLIEMHEKKKSYLYNTMEFRA